MTHKIFAVTAAVILAGLAIKYWWLLLAIVVLIWSVKSVKIRHRRIAAERAALAARADAGVRNHLSGGTGLFDENKEMYYPTWLEYADRQRKGECA